MSSMAEDYVADEVHGRTDSSWQSMQILVAEIFTAEALVAEVARRFSWQRSSWQRPSWQRKLMAEQIGKVERKVLTKSAVMAAE